MLMMLRPLVDEDIIEGQFWFLTNLGLNFVKFKFLI